ncbi:MAG: DUF547 domain-containing protein [Saprospiraceae bacterium]|jgi:hypothetical protein|nr:DUF547 domain-containing protein [Saprospiraceae bacterium]
MRPFLNVFLIVLIAAFLSSCDNGNKEAVGENSTSVNVEVGAAADSMTIIRPGESDPESQRNPDIMAEAKKAALEKANANANNSNFRDIAPKSVKKTLVEEATSTSRKVDGQDFKRVEGAKVKYTKKTKQYTPEQLAVPLVSPDLSRTKDGKVASTTTFDTKSDATQATTPSKKTIHDLWDELLKRNVLSNGTVNYTAIKARKTVLNEYLKILSENPPQANWSRAKTMAFWINAYNAFTIKLIVDNMPVKSIKDLEGGKPWDKKWIKIGNKTYSLNIIENDILRPKYKDARIHFAVNCAAKSCPPIWNRAWTEANLDHQLEERTKIFIDNNKFNQVSETKAKISKIFEWYASDFGNLITYLNKYTTENIATNATVTYKEYDWSLNGN